MKYIPKHPDQYRKGSVVNHPALGVGVVLSSYTIYDGPKYQMNTGRYAPRRRGRTYLKIRFLGRPFPRPQPQRVELDEAAGVLMVIGHRPFLLVLRKDFVSRAAIAA